MALDPSATKVRHVEDLSAGGLLVSVRLTANEGSPKTSRTGETASATPMLRELLRVITDIWRIVTCRTRARFLPRSSFVNSDPRSEIRPGPREPWRART